MKSEKQRIKIAEACGYRCVQSHSLHGTPPLRDIRYYSELIPDYTGDLNAMHEAEAVLADEQHGVFRRHLAEIVNKRNDTSTRLMSTAEYRAWFTATATQRAEAFLRTLGLWEDEA